MVSFRDKVEASYEIVEADIRTALKKSFTKKIEKAVPVSKPKNTETPKPKAAKGDGEYISFSNLTKTKQLIPFIEKELQKTNPADFKSKSWGRFTKNVIPRLLTAMLLDMNIIPVSRKVEFMKYLDRILRPLAK
jgi:hypothetical protein